MFLSSTSFWRQSVLNVTWFGNGGCYHMSVFQFILFYNCSLDTCKKINSERIESVPFSMGWSRFCVSNKAWNKNSKFDQVIPLVHLDWRIFTLRFTNLIKVHLISAQFTHNYSRLGNNKVLNTKIFIRWCRLAGMSVKPSYTDYAVNWRFVL